MQAAYYKGNKQFEVSATPIILPVPGEVRLKVAYQDNPKPRSLLLVG